MMSSVTPQLVRMADRILGNSLTPPTWLAPCLGPKDRQAHTQQLQERIREALIITADDAAEHIWAVSDQEEWSVSSDFPMWLPPSTSFWVECRRPSLSRSEEWGTRPTDTMPRNWGILFGANRCDVTIADALRQRHDPEYRERVLKQLRGQVSTAGRILGPGLAAKHEQYGASWKEHLTLAERNFLMEASLLLAAEEGREDEILRSMPKSLAWFVQGLLYLEPTPGTIIGPLASWQFSLDSEGRVCGEPRFGLMLAQNSLPPPEDEWTALNCYIFPALLAMRQLTAGAATLQPCIPPEAFAQSYRKKNGRPLLPRQRVTGDFTAAPNKEAA